MTFDLQAAIDTQQRLVTSLQAKAAAKADADTNAALAHAIAGLRDLQAMANKPQSSAQNSPVTPPYQIR